MDLGGNSRQQADSSNEGTNSGVLNGEPGNINNINPNPNIEYNIADNNRPGNNLYMPAANVRRIMRTILPSHARIADDAVESVQEAVSEFISFVTNEANERVQLEHRRTINAEDLLFAMRRLEFDNYVQPLTEYLNRYRELEAERNSVPGVPNVVRRVDFAPPQVQRQSQPQPPQPQFQLVAPQRRHRAARNPPVVVPGHDDAAESSAAKGN